MANVELTASQQKELMALDQAIQALRVSLNRAAQAGLDVAELQQRLDQANTRRVGMLTQFGPSVNARTQRQ